MEYDLNIHLPAQLEAFFQSLLKGDWQTFNSSLDIVKNMVADDILKKGLEEYENDFNEKIKLLDKKTYETIRTSPNVKTLDDIIKIVEILQEDSNKVYNEYTTVIMNYVIDYFKG